MKRSFDLCIGCNPGKTTGEYLSLYLQILC